MILRRIYPLVIVLLLLISCNNKSDLSDSIIIAHPLNITTSNGDTHSEWVTKAGGVAEPYNTKDSTLSVSRLADVNAGLSASSNVKYVFGTVWAPASGVSNVIAAATTKVCAYAPYNKDYSDLTKIPLKSWMSSGVGSSSDHELYYSPSVTGSVVAGKSNITFALKRAYVLLRFTLNGMSTLNGVGNVTDFSIYSKNLPESSTIDITSTSATYGAVVANSTHRMTYSILKGGYINQNLSTSPVIEVLLPPCTLYDASNKTLDATITVDGIQRFIRLDLTANGMGGALPDGSCYEIGVSLNLGVAAESNCYIIKPGSTIYIPVSRAVKGYAAAGGIGFTTGTPYTVGLLWSDVSTSQISTNVQGQYIRITASNIEGNSMIYAMVDGVIVWSWHIWVTNYAPGIAPTGTLPTVSGGTIATYNTRYWLDRNLGALNAGPTAAAYGLYYQWGRKDPFLPLDKKTYGLYVLYLSNSPVRYLSSIVYPFNFYSYYKSGTPNWCLSPDNYWGTQIKSIYDPCPQGYRVPFKNYFSGTFLNNTLGGAIKGDGSFASNVGIWWTCSYPSGSIVYANAWGNNGSSALYYRAFAFSMRCVQE